jgi:hypothetical protein
MVGLASGEQMLSHPLLHEISIESSASLQIRGIPSRLVTAVHDVEHSGP